LSAEATRPVRSYFWSRDSKYVLYAQDAGGDENFNVYAIDPTAAADPKTGVPITRALTDLKGVRTIIYAAPRTAYAASFLGKSNLVAATVKQGVAESGAFTVPVKLADGPVTFSLRPECITPASASIGEDLVQFAAEVVAEQFHGADSLLTLRCAGGMELSARIAGPLSNSGGFAFQAQDLIPLEQE